MMDFSFRPKRVVRLFATVIACIVTVHLIGQGSYFLFGLDGNNWLVRGLLEEFHLSKEKNLPTYYSALALLFCSSLLALIALVKRRRKAAYASHWAGLAVIFLFLSVDEMLQWHEILVPLVRGALNTSGLLYFAWVIPYGFLVLVFALVYFKFTLQLPAATRRRFILAGLLFLSGAIGVEMLGGRHAERYGMDTFLMVVYQTLEETLEIVGVLIFMYALGVYINSHLGGLWLRIGPEDTH